MAPDHLRQNNQHQVAIAGHHQPGFKSIIYLLPKISHFSPPPSDNSKPSIPGGIITFSQRFIDLPRTTAFQDSGRQTLTQFGNLFIQLSTISIFPAVPFRPLMSYCLDPLASIVVTEFGYLDARGLPLGPHLLVRGFLLRLLVVPAF